MSKLKQLREEVKKVTLTLKELMDHPLLQNEGKREGRQDAVLAGVCDALLEMGEVEDIVLALGRAITDRVVDGQEPHLDPQTGKKLARLDVIAQRLYRSVVEGF